MIVCTFYLGTEQVHKTPEIPLQLPDPGCECGVCEGVTEVDEEEKSFWEPAVPGGGLYLSSVRNPPALGGAAVGPPAE